MVKIINNILSPSQIDFIKGYINNNCNHIILNKYHNWYYNYNISSGSIEEVKNVLGVQWFFICKQIKTEISNLLDSEVRIYSVKTIVSTSDYKIEYHKDGSVFGKELENSFTCLIYLNKEWNENLGGLWTDGNIKILPIQGISIFYSRDIEHAVTDSLANWPENRYVFLTSWSKH
jgi:hypothetical protein